MLRVTRIENSNGESLEPRVNFLLGTCIDPDLCAISLNAVHGCPKEYSSCSLAVRNSNWLGQLDVSGLFRSSACVPTGFYLIQAMTKIAAHNRSGAAQKLSLEQPEISADIDSISRFAVLNRVSSEFIGQVLFCEQGQESELASSDFSLTRGATQETMLAAIAECHKLFAYSQGVQ